MGFTPRRKVPRSVVVASVIGVVTAIVVAVVGGFQWLRNSSETSASEVMKIVWTVVADCGGAGGDVAACERHAVEPSVARGLDLALHRLREACGDPLDLEGDLEGAMARLSAEGLEGPWMTFQGTLESERCRTEIAVELRKIDERWKITGLRIDGALRWTHPRAQAAADDRIDPSSGPEAADVREERPRITRVETADHADSDASDRAGVQLDSDPTPPSRSLATGVVPEAGYTIDTAGLPRKGASATATVTMVECGDFDCPFCGRARTTVDAMIADYPQLAVFWLHNPLAHHVRAEPAARAAVAAHAQGKFWEMHDKLFDDTSSRSDEQLRELARDLGLDLARFDADFAAESTTAAIRAQSKICRDNDATGTPSFFIDGRLVTGARAKREIAAMIDAALAEAR